MSKGDYVVVTNDHGLETRNGNFNTLFGATMFLAEEITLDLRDFYDGDHERFNEDVENGLLSYKIESWGSGDIGGCLIAVYNFIPRVDEYGEVKFV